MRVYVAASQHDWLRARRVMRDLEAAGLTVSHDWTIQVEEHLGQDPDEDTKRWCAEMDYQGVRDADALLVLTPLWKQWGAGLWTELGIALAMGKLIVVTGPRRDSNIFTQLAVRVSSDQDGIMTLVKEAGWDDELR